MTFEPALPEEARGDQFETATPAHFGEVGVDGQEELRTPHADGTSTQETSDAVTYLPDTYPDVVIVQEIDANLIPGVFTNEDGLKIPEPGDETSMGTTTSIPHTPSVSSPALTTTPGSAFQGTPEPDGVSSCDDKEGSSSCGGDVETGVTPEGSAVDAPPTPTDETEIGGTELPTFVPDTWPRETTPRPETDNEGSASGEDEASGQDMDPAETPRFTSTIPPLYSTHSQQPPVAAGVEIKEVPVVLPHVDTVTEAGSGVEQLSGQEEVSGEKGGPIDLPREVTLLPDVEAVTSESSTRAYPTQPSFVSPDDKQHPFMEHAPTTTPPSQPYSLQTDHSTTIVKPHISQATPPYSGRSVDSVPQGTLISEPTAATPSESHVDKEIPPPQLESQTQTPQETATTKQLEGDTGVSLEASTVNIKGA